MRISIAALLASALIPASSQAMTLLDISRWTSIAAWYYDPDGQHGERSSEINTTPGEWTSNLRGGEIDLVHASQHSLVSETELSGTGNAGEWVVEDGARTKFYVAFSVDEDTAYDFAVDNFNRGCCMLWNPGGFVTLSEVDPNNRTQILQAIHSVVLGRDDRDLVGYPDVFTQGVLAPGTYALTYDLRASGSRYASGSGLSGFSFVVTPEPSTAILLAMGLVGIAARRWR